LLRNAAVDEERTGRVDRRTKLKPDEKALLQKLQRGTWSLAELEWLERQLPKDAPTLLVAELRHRMAQLRTPERRDNHVPL
jgi:hypothetical protein